MWELPRNQSHYRHTRTSLQKILSNKKSVTRRNLWELPSLLWSLIFALQLDLSGLDFGARCEFLKRTPKPFAIKKPVFFP